MLWYSAFSLPWPMYSLVATLNCVTALPLARLRISGSRVRRPVNRTLFTVRVLLLDRPDEIVGRSLRSGGNDAAVPAHAPTGARRWQGRGAGPGGRAIRRVGDHGGRRTVEDRSAEPAGAWRANRTVAAGPSPVLTGLFASDHPARSVRTD